MRRGILFTRRLLLCQIALQTCGLCGVRGTTGLYDADLLTRVCDDCGEDAGTAQIELHTARMVAPSDALILANP